MTTPINEVGYRAGLAACAATVAYDVVQILQIMGVLKFPLDEILIYTTSLCIVVPFILEMLALHYATTPGGRLAKAACSPTHLILPARLRMV